LRLTATPLCQAATPAQLPLETVVVEECGDEVGVVGFEVVEVVLDEVVLVLLLLTVVVGIGVLPPVNAFFTAMS
jgi:hypothetical protein